MVAGGVVESAKAFVVLQLPPQFFLSTIPILVDRAGVTSAPKHPIVVGSRHPTAAPQLSRLRIAGTRHATSTARTMTTAPMMATVNGAPIKCAVTPANMAPIGMKPRSSM